MTFAWGLSAFRVQNASLLRGKMLDAGQQTKYANRILASCLLLSCFYSGAFRSPPNPFGFIFCILVTV